MTVTGNISVKAGGIVYKILADDQAPVFDTARSLLDSFAMGGEQDTGEVILSLVLVKENPEAVSSEIHYRLGELPNACQAYAIVSEGNNPLEITLAAKTPIGLLYAVRTLVQLVKPGHEATPGSTLQIPVVHIMDWPDIAQRGEWASRGYPSLDWYALWKLNMYRITTRSSTDEAGRMVDFRMNGIKDADRFREHGARLGYTFIPYIIHLGHLSGREWSGIAVPDWPEEVIENLSRPHMIGFDWSNPVIHELLEAHMRELAEHAVSPAGQPTDIEVWLSEWGGFPGGYYLEEAKAIVGAFERLREVFPDLRLRILLSQGSDQSGDNPAIMDLLHEYYVCAAYYQGQDTYRSDRRPMVPTVLENFINSGGKADIMPQTEPNIRTVMPGSMPQLIQFRAQEFVNKGLQSATAYIVPDRFHYTLNMAAWGEYTWNANGRSPFDFARAYATITGMQNPDLYARWVSQAGEAAWNLASLHYSTQAHSDLMVLLARRNFSLRPLNEEQEHIFATGMKQARRALELAEEADEPIMIYESATTLSAYRFLQHYLIALHGQNARVPDIGQMDESDVLRELFSQSHSFRHAIYQWMQAVASSKRAELGETGPEWLDISYNFLGEQPGIPSHRFVYTAYSLLRAFENLPDNNNGLMVLKEWESESVSNDGLLDMEFDLSGIIPAQGGEYSLSADLYPDIREASLTHIELTKGSPEDRKTLFLIDTALTFRTRSGYDLPFRIPERNPDEPLNMRIRLQMDGPTPGKISLRTHPFSRP